MEKQFEAIITLINTGFAAVVMDAARAEELVVEQLLTLVEQRIKT